MTPKLSADTIEARRNWLVPALFAGIGLLFGIAGALGFQTPVARLTKVESRVDGHDLKLTDHEVRIQRLEDTKDTIEAIARAVGAPVKRTR